MVNWIQIRFLDFEFINATHRKSIISKHAQIGKGIVVAGGSIINTDVIIDDHCIINTNSSIGHDSKSANYSTNAPGATMGDNTKIDQLSAISMGAINHNKFL